MGEFERLFGDASEYRPVDLDELDLEILALLAQDGRLSARSMAKRLGKSPGAILERQGRLERDGVIRGYSADIDPARLGVGMTVIVGVEAAHGSGLADTIGRIQQIPETHQVLVVTGTWDLLVVLRVRDHRHLSQVLFGELWTLGGFRRSHTMTVLHETAAGHDDLAALAGRTARRRPPGNMPAGTESSDVDEADANRLE